MVQPLQPAEVVTRSATPTAAEVRVQLLGDVRLFFDGEAPVAPPSAPQRRLLAVLALLGPCSRSPGQLADLMSVSPGSVRTSMSRLRRSTGHDPIATGPSGYCFVGAVDVREFSRLAVAPAGNDRLREVELALSMWHGDPLIEFREEPWASPEVSRVHELRAKLIEERAELLICAGRGAEAIAPLLAHVDRRPLRDRPRGLLMLALAREGRQVEALRAYQRYRSFLGEELGAAPSAWVSMIERRVASSDCGDVALLVERGRCRQV